MTDGRLLTSSGAIPMDDDDRCRLTLGSVSPASDAVRRRLFPAPGAPPPPPAAAAGAAPPPAPPPAADDEEEEEDDDDDDKLFALYISVVVVVICTAPLLVFVILLKSMDRTLKRTCLHHGGEVVGSESKQDDAKENGGVQRARWAAWVVSRTCSPTFMTKSSDASLSS